MKLVFSGLETPVELVSGVVSTLQIENEALFTRIVRSLDCSSGDFALESYAVWNEGVELKAEASILFVSDLLHLPWDSRELMGEVIKQFEREFLEDEDFRYEVESMDLVLSSRLLKMGFALNSDYGFKLEWDLKRYLKFRGFGVGCQDSESLLDNLLNFLSLALDAGCKKAIVFVNLKTFLTQTELKKFFEYVFYSKLKVLLVENKQDKMLYDYENKTIVDLQFIEYKE